jgi:hypothetical protein
MDEKDFEYKFNKLKDNRVLYTDLIIKYMIQTVEDILSDLDIELDEADLQKICYKVYTKVRCQDNLDDLIYKELTKIVGDKNE